MRSALGQRMCDACTCVLQVLPLRRASPTQGPPKRGPLPLIKMAAQGSLELARLVHGWKCLCVNRRCEGHSQQSMHMGSACKGVRAGMHMGNACKGVRAGMRAAMSVGYEPEKARAGADADVSGTSKWPFEEGLLMIVRAPASAAVRHGPS